MSSVLLDEGPKAPTEAERGFEAEFTIVIPTRNEADNIEPLLGRLHAALGGIDAEVVFVDDSDDNTPDVIRAAAVAQAEQEAVWAHTRVRLLHRPKGARSGGLGGAVAAGIDGARAPWVIVMDGDLQHPPETLPEIMAETRDYAGSTAPDQTQELRAGVDVVIASRYAKEGRADGLGGAWRRLVSRTSGTVAELVFPRRLARVTDPMSGFFAVRRAALRLATLRPVGYKILLEILIRARISRTAEVPYTFLPRVAGESKASLREGLRFGRHLAGLRLATVVRPASRPARALGFAAAGASGIAVNSALLWALSGELALPYLVAAFLSMQAAVAWNFLMVDRFVMPSTERRLHRRFGRFWLVNNSLVPVHLAVLAGLVQGLGIHLLIANVIAIGAVFIVRYMATSRWVYGQREPVSTAAVRKVAGAGRRSVQIRFALGLLLTLAAFPAATMAAWDGLLGGGPHVSLIVPLAVAGALLVGRLKPAETEPNVHDRQVDGLIAAALLLASGTLAALAPDRHASSAWVLLAMVSFLAGATVLLLGTRTAARLRWTLVLPLVALAAATPPAAAQALQRFGGAPFFNAVVCLLLAALSCYGLTRRFTVGVAVALPTLVAVAMVVRLGTDRFDAADRALLTGVALAATVAAFAWFWSVGVAVQRVDGRHYVPRGRLAFAVLAVVAMLLAVPGSPILPAVDLPSVDAGGGQP